MSTAHTSNCIPIGKSTRLEGTHGAVVTTLNVTNVHRAASSRHVPVQRLEAKSGRPDKPISLGWASDASQALMLELVGQAPISFHRIYVDVTGDVLSGLWLSNAIRKIPPIGGINEEGLFEFSLNSQEVHAETGMTRTQHERCRRILTGLELLNETARRGRGLVYTLNMNRLVKLMQGHTSDLAQKLRAHTGAMNVAAVAAVAQSLVAGR